MTFFPPQSSNTKRSFFDVFENIFLMITTSADHLYLLFVSSMIFITCHQVYNHDLVVPLSSLFLVQRKCKHVCFCVNTSVSVNDWVWSKFVNVLDKNTTPSIKILRYQRVNWKVNRRTANTMVKLNMTKGQNTKHYTEN